MTRRLRSREAETGDVNARRQGRKSIKRRHIDRWAVGHDELAPGIVGDTHLGARIINETHIDPGTYSDLKGSAQLSDLYSVEIDAEALWWTPSTHANPQVAYDPATETSWIAYLKTGGDLYATSYDHRTGDIATPELVASYPFGTADFHHAVAVMLDDEGKLHIIWGGHNDAHRHYRMDNARDLTSWTGQTLNAGTYPFAVVTDDGELIFTDRPGDDHGSTFPTHRYGSMYRSTDGATWTQTEIVDTSGFAESHSDFYQGDLLWADGRAHMVWTVARGGDHDSTKQNLYYASLDPATGDWAAADGTNLGAIITSAEHATCLVATLTSSRVRCSVAWQHGAPVVAYAAQDSGAGDEQVFVASWNGSSWGLSDMLVSGVGIDLPVLVSTPDELTVLVRDTGWGDIDQFRLVDGEWVNTGVLLRAVDGETYQITPVGDGPVVAIGVWRDPDVTSADDTTVGPLRIITGDHYRTPIDHDHDYADPDHEHSALTGELLMADGVTAPPVPIETEARDDWLYEDV